MKKTNIYFDCEFTGLNQKTTLISIWLVADNWSKFYAEFTDYDTKQVDSWIQENVIDNLTLKWESYPNSNRYSWNSEFIKEKLTEWITSFSSVDIWSDCLSYDWVLFNTLLADYNWSYPQLPSCINYIPFDICTLFKIKGIDPDISREEFVKDWLENKKIKKHNALFDAEIIQQCYFKLSIQY